MQYRAKVVKGKGRGKAIVGFPTFNLEIPAGFNTKEGVHACKVWIHGTKYDGAMHYGITPTFDDHEKVLEIFVLNYEDAVPVDELTFEVGHYLRPIATFMDPKDLRAQIALDVQRIRSHSANH
jgi:riboflavin kinase/FMN adenylyltransferase